MKFIKYNMKIYDIRMIYIYRIIIFIFFCFDVSNTYMIFFSFIS